MVQRKERTGRNPQTGREEVTPDILVHGLADKQCRPFLVAKVELGTH
jgi:hypothetical protein